MSRLVTRTWRVESRVRRLPRRCSRRPQGDLAATHQAERAAGLAHVRGDWRVVGAARGSAGEGHKKSPALSWERAGRATQCDQLIGSRVRARPVRLSEGERPHAAHAHAERGRTTHENRRADDGGRAACSARGASLGNPNRALACVSTAAATTRCRASRVRAVSHLAKTTSPELGVRSACSPQPTVEGWGVVLQERAMGRRPDRPHRRAGGRGGPPPQPSLPAVRRSLLASVRQVYVRCPSCHVPQSGEGRLSCAGCSAARVIVVGPRVLREISSRLGRCS